MDNVGAELTLPVSPRTQSVLPRTLIRNPSSSEEASCSPQESDIPESHLVVVDRDNCQNFGVFRREGSGYVGSTELDTASPRTVDGQSADLTVTDSYSFDSDYTDWDSFDGMTDSSASGSSARIPKFAGEAGTIPLHQWMKAVELEFRRIGHGPHPLTKRQFMDCLQQYLDKTALNIFTQEYDSVMARTETLPAEPALEGVAGRREVLAMEAQPEGVNPDGTVRPAIPAVAYVAPVQAVAPKPALPERTGLFRRFIITVPVSGCCQDGRVRQLPRLVSRRNCTAESAAS